MAKHTAPKIGERRKAWTADGHNDRWSIRAFLTRDEEPSTDTARPPAAGSPSGKGE